MRRRGILFLAIFVVLIMVLSLNIKSQNAVAEKAGSDYKGPEYCGSCHSNEYQEWSGTMHSQAFSDPIFQAVWNASGSPPECLSCHTTGFNSETGEFALEGVTCERCHGGPGKMEKTLSASLCGECHIGAHHPTFEEWNQSKHSESIETLIAIGQDKNERCLSCHSAEGALGTMLNKSWSIKEAIDPVTCAVCHEPMSLELRMESSSDLCGQCHTGQYSLWSANSPHEIIGVGCSDCHMYTRPYSSEDVPAITGHTFEIVEEGGKPVICQNCHGTVEGIPDYETAVSVMISIQTDIQSIKEEVKAAINSTEKIINEVSTISGVDTSALEEASTLLNDAKHTFEIEVERAYSNGFHNPTEMMKLINTILEKIGKAKELALEAKAKALKSQLSSLETQLAESQDEINNLKIQISNLNEQVSTLEKKVSELQGGAGTSQLYLLISLFSGLVLGALATYLIKRKP